MSSIITSWLNHAVAVGAPIDRDFSCVPPMTDRPTKDDFDRTLSTLATRALNQLQVERNQIKGQAAAIGALHGNRLIIAIADAADKIHVSTMAQVTTTLHEFTQRMELSPIQISSWARPGLENFGNTLLAQIPENGFPADHQRIVAEHRVEFIKRLDAALRDVVIGLGGPANSRAHPRFFISNLECGAQVLTLRRCSRNSISGFSTGRRIAMVECRL